MLIQATNQAVAGTVYTLTGNDDLNVAAGVTLISTGFDAILANTGQHVITVSGTILAYDDAINTIGCEAAQSVIIAQGGVLIGGYTGMEDDGDGVILDGIGSTLLNNGTIIANGTGISLFVRDAGTTTVTNNGFVSGDKFAVWNKFGIGVLNFTNTGTIESAGIDMVESQRAAYFGGTGVDNLTNSGTIIGNVLLNDGDDLYVGALGTVVGTINGGGGNDRFVLGGAAADVIDGGFGHDTLDLSAVTTAMVIDLANGANNRGATLGDSYSNIEVVLGGTKADVITGDAQNNELYGRNGSDRLNGGAGQDVLCGGTGGDILTGGAGADTFLFLTQAEFGDAITDFEAGLDIIRIEGGSIGFGTYSGGLQSTQFHAGTSNLAQNAQHRFVFNTTNATLWFDKDGSGTKFASILVADLQDGAMLTAASIDII